MIDHIAYLVVAGISTPAQAMPGVPNIECELRMKLWCIANFDGRIEVSDDGSSRTWTLRDRLYMKEGPLKIIENKSCGAERGVPTKIYEKRITDSGENQYQSVKYKLSEEPDCTLEFQYPVSAGGLNPVYQQVIRFGIISCNVESCGDQLNVFDRSSTSK